MRTTESMTFTYTHTLVISGIVANEEIEIEGRVNFLFSPGCPARGPSYASGGEPAESPEIEIGTIEIYGHDPKRVRDPQYKGEYRELAPSATLWNLIASWLESECFDEMCDAVGDPSEDYADAMNDAARDERLLNEPCSIAAE
ncbi:hypothetical protein [Telmatospirillum sp.]|uniref:hypothetical protein n=1 Tax=Telmatospirillum sp. TaxID=2079197 RepID=UPI00283C4212|nr:hypothetical protein [Telmatospirillum sp.]MDR3439855.1 hypothetical protein [Telmatospirillum sp.]